MTGDHPGWIPPTDDMIRAAFNREPDWPYDAVHPHIHAAMTGQPAPDQPAPDLLVPSDPAGLDSLFTDVTPERTAAVARLMDAMYRQQARRDRSAHLIRMHATGQITDESLDRLRAAIHAHRDGPA